MHGLTLSEKEIIADLGKVWDDFNRVVGDGLTLQGDVFPEDSLFVDDYTPEEVAREFWSNVITWVDMGYLPVVTVLMPDGTSHDIDLEKHDDD